MREPATTRVEPGTTGSGTLLQQIDVIAATHHAFLRRVLPEIGARLLDVAEDYGTRYPELMPLRMIFIDFRSELESYVDREEQVLFGQIRLVDPSARLQGFQRDALRNAVRSMAAEHEASLAELEAMRRLTSGFTTPEGAGDDLRALYRLFEELMIDLREHCRRENEELFPALQDLLDAA